MNAPAHLQLVDTGRVTAPARRCAFCDKRLRKAKRSNARTCSKACRQKLSRRDRARHVSCDATTLRRDEAPLLTAAARDRAGLAELAGDVLAQDAGGGAAAAEPSREPAAASSSGKRILIVGRIGPKEVRID